MSSVGTSLALLCGIGLALVVVVGICSAIPFVLVSCVKREDASGERGMFASISFCGYIFDFRAFYERAKLSSTERMQYVEESQLRTYYRVVAMEQYIIRIIEAGIDVDRRTYQQLRRISVYRQTLGIRTRDARRRRRRRVEEIQEEQLTINNTPPRFCDQLSYEEKCKVLNSVLQYQKYEGVNHSTEEEAESSLIKNHSNKLKKARVISKLSNYDQTADDDNDISIQSSSSLTNKMDENKSDICTVCLDEFGKGDILAGRPTVCTHVFHKDCLSAWLERQECCPICRQTILSEGERKQIHHSKTRNEKKSEFDDIQLSPEEIAV